MEKSIHSPEQKKLQDLLRQIRLAAGYRQSDLADKLRKPQSFVSKYEKGERRLDFLEVKKICDTLGISLTEFARRLENILR